MMWRAGVWRFSMRLLNKPGRKIIEMENLGRVGDRGEYVSRIVVDGVAHLSKVERLARDDDETLNQRRETRDLAFLASLGIDGSSFRVLRRPKP